MPVNCLSSRTRPLMDAVDSSNPATDRHRKTGHHEPPRDFRRLIELSRRAATSRDGVLIFDKEIRGFVLWVSPSDWKVSRYKYQSPTDHRSRRLGLGTFPSTTAEEARARALSAAAAVEDGRDPKGDDSDELQRRTMADAFPLYLAERRGKIAPRTMAEYERLWVV